MNVLMNNAGKLYKIVCGLLLTTMVLIVFVNTVLRYFFSSGIVLAEELLRYLFVWASFLSILAVYKDRGHLGVTMFSDKLSGRPKALLSLFTNILILYAMSFFVSGGIINMETSATTVGQTTGIPFPYIIAASIVAAVGIGFLVILDMIRDLRILAGKGDS